MRVLTIGHGTRSREELAETLLEAGAGTLVDVRRYPGSLRNPQFNREGLAAALEAAGIRYRHAVELGGRRSGEPGEERFACIRVAAFRSYAARMAQAEWLAALDPHARGAAAVRHVRGDALAALSPPPDRRPANRSRP
jgi:uncharacterized protein (DUF488 family)